MDCSTYPWSLPYKEGSIQYHFWIFGMTQPGIELCSPGPFVNTLTIKPIHWHNGYSVCQLSGKLGSIPGRVILKTQKNDASWLNTQHYKVRIKGKWSNPRKEVAFSPIPQSQCSSKTPLISILDMTLNNSAGALRNVEYPFIANRSQVHSSPVW